MTAGGVRRRGRGTQLLSTHTNTRTDARTHTDTHTLTHRHTHIHTHSRIHTQREMICHTSFHTQNGPLITLFVSVVIHPLSCCLMVVVTCGTRVVWCVTHNAHVWCGAVCCGGDVRCGVVVVVCGAVRCGVVWYGVNAVGARACRLCTQCGYVCILCICTRAHQKALHTRMQLHVQFRPVDTIEFMPPMIAHTHTHHTAWTVDMIWRVGGSSCAVPAFCR